MIFAQTGYSPRAIAFDTSKPIGVLSRAADLTRARERLGWEPRVSFEQLVKMMYEADLAEESNAVDRA